MGDLRVRRSRGFAVPAYQGADKAEKQAGSSPARQAASRPVADVSGTLRQLMARASQAEGPTQEARRALQTGEAVLAEVQEGLAGLEDLARQAAGEGAADRGALQEELEQLRGEILRILQDGAAAGLFQNAALGSPPAGQDGLQGLPPWLLWGMAGNAPSQDTLLAALGIDSAATGPQLLAALARLPLDESPAAGYLAALYLGAAIASGPSDGTLDPALAAEGLRRLLELVGQGTAPDQAVKALTGGRFSSLEDFQSQFTGGTAPGLQDFLTGLLLAGDGTAIPSMPSILPFLAGGGGEGGLDLLMGLLATLESAGAVQAPLGTATAPPALQGSGAPQPGPQGMPGTPSGLPAPQSTGDTAPAPPPTGQAQEAMPNAPAGALPVSGGKELALQGAGENAPALHFTGPGTVHIHQAAIPLVAVDTPQARMACAGASTLAQVQLGQGAALTLEGTGHVHIGTLRGGPGSTLRLAGGAVSLAGEGPTPPTVPIVVTGPVSLLAAQGTPVYDAQGKPLQPFDLLWKALLPGWESIASLAINGKQQRLSLLRGDPIRLWLAQGDPSHGYPAHGVVLQGRDQVGRLRTRYVYLRWSQQAGAFEPVPLYPNPFTITGGQQGADWHYEDGSGTLHILTSQVSAISGGAGIDANQLPFSGRLALADGIGQVGLALGGVVCRVPSGRAFSLGSGNQVTLLLRDGTQNIFESGAGYAGISMGDGASLHISRAAGGDGPAGVLTAAGGAGSPGIGRDSGVGRGRSCPILIHSGDVTTISGAPREAPPAPQGPRAPSMPRALPQALGLDTLDVSTREAARASLAALAASRRRVAQLQGACSTLYGQLEQQPPGLRSIRQYARMVRDTEEAGALLWDMCNTPGQSLAAHSFWGWEDPGQLLR